MKYYITTPLFLMSLVAALFWLECLDAAGYSFLTFASILIGPCLGWEIDNWLNNKNKPTP